MSRIVHRLRNRWIRSFGGPDFFDEWVLAHLEEHRDYHTVFHIQSCFDVLDDNFQDTADAVTFAIWFHDFVYDTHAKDNEERSAQVAKEHVPANVADEVVDLILATKTHVASTENAKVLLDVDLSILSEEPAIFDGYEQGIRKEYAWVPEETYRTARAGILQGFLDRPRIYMTGAMAYREPLARANIGRSLKMLLG